MASEVRESYRRFTQPAELHKAINTLRGIVMGISTDTKVSDAEVAELAHWCQVHGYLRDKHPFSEILPVIESALEDGMITEDESKDILWVCSAFTSSGTFYDNITSSIQFLSGLVHGIMADNQLSDDEIMALRRWSNDNEYLSGCYPYDEINSLLSSILADQRIDEDERSTLLAFLSNLVEFKDSLNLSEQDYTAIRQEYSVSGICASCPEIEIEGHSFCLTGESYRATRKEFMEIIKELGGTVKSGVSSKLNYLVVGNSGNPCWAYACYGRKIEEAMELRRMGYPIVIVNETDLWDVIDDLQAGIVD